MFSFDFSNNTSSAAATVAVSSSCADSKENAVCSTACAVLFFISVIISFVIFANNVFLTVLMCPVMIADFLKNFYKGEPRS